MSSSQTLLDLSHADKLLATAVNTLSDPELPAGHAAYAALLIEHLAGQLSRAQLHAAEAVRRTGAHKLDAQSLQMIADAGLDPTPAQAQAATGRTTGARTHFKKALDLLAGWLNIPASTARERLATADQLIAQVTEAGEQAAPGLPILAAAFADPDLDPRLVISAARKFKAADKDLGAGDDAESIRSELEALAVELICAQPATARKHIGALIAQAVGEKRPPQDLLSQIGVYPLGIRRGLEHFLIKVLPSQGETWRASFRAIDNPKTVAGNREALAAQAAALREDGAAGQWDDESTMPDWAKDPAVETADSQEPEGVGHTEAHDFPEEPADAEEPGETADTEPAESCAPENGTHPEDASPLAPFEDLRPELRHLLGLMAVLQAHVPAASGAGDSAHAVITPQIGVLLDYGKMVETGHDFATTASGIPISAGEARAMVCNAGLYPVVLNGKSQILDLGRTQRLFSKAQARAIRAAYRGCAYPGCSMPAERCELDHLDKWERGGCTDIESSDLYCTVHHIARHCGLFHAVKVKGSRPMVLLPPELDPEQKLQFNTYFFAPSQALHLNRQAREATALWRAGKLDAQIADP
ncbi:HNH endonuclease signature motif containing protein [Glutamicibacter sp. NPDC087344]|uniref:HNH endonuclease signature motif containing protein n=1 Tax=Glutamicibacter sp. NPDC087344 TaxID=3363994 RepID=UPI00380A96CD